MNFWSEYEWVGFVIGPIVMFAAWLLLSNRVALYFHKKQGQSYLLFFILSLLLIPLLFVVLIVSVI
jgi:uncharacterized membrane protein YhdT